MASLGQTSKLYVNTGNYTTPVWDEQPGISDLKIDLAWDTGDASTRNSAVKAEEPTQLGLGLSGKHLDDAGLDYLRLDAAFFARTSLDVMALNGAMTVNNNTGIRIEGKLGSWSEDQGLGNVNFRDFAIKPGITSNPAKSVVITGGAPVFTAIG